MRRQAIFYFGKLDNRTNVAAIVAIHFENFFAFFSTFFSLHL
jgi:hypothetical protein